MGKIQVFQIAFDNPSGAFYAGQSVTGKVMVYLNEEISIKGIFVHLNGKAHVSWSESESYRDSDNTSHTRTVTRSDSQTYFDIKFALQGTERINKLGPGKFHYPFNINLPMNLPSSFEGTHGHIRYICSSNISRPWRFDPKCKAAITILELVDLNLIPGAGFANTLQNSKNTGMCCCQGGAISAVVSTNKAGFVPGENIYISANINNESDEEIRRTTAALLSWTTYKAGSHTKRESKTICSIDRGMIRAHSSDQWVNQPLRIPSIPPTLLNSACRIMNIEYFLQFTVDPSGTFSSDLEFTFPITIGSIPLRTDFSTFVSAPPIFSQPASVEPPLLNYEGAMSYNPVLPSAPMEAPATFSGYADLPPPSYEECVYGKVNIREADDEHTSGELSYAPKYMYYNQTQLQNN